ncbi:MAG: hypothetical protein PHW46_02495 [Candidatus Omnitrophica bacterium]|nr:hypothetical protein [Candidatus Omnitrophota bacterium]
MATAFLFANGCAPTYPKETLPEAVKEICKSEYNMNVEVTVEGNTIGIYYPMTGLLDVNLGISEQAWDTISNLLLIASRIVLSTDADIKFYCLVTQDARLPELQVVIIKYVDDVKRSLYTDISRDETFKRTLFSINLTPQAKKERSIERIFDKLEVDPAARDKVLEEFFRSQPTKLSDIGYWRGKFYLKDITLEEFLAAQIVNRMKMDFRVNKDLAGLFNYEEAESVYVPQDSTGSFFVKFKIADQKQEDDGKNIRIKKIQEILRIANEVVYGYKFQKFDYLVLEDLLENAKLKITGSNVYNYAKEKSPIEKIVEAPAGYF